MKNLNKSLLLVICLILLMGLVGCTNQDASKETASTNQEVKKSDSGQTAVTEKKDEFTYSVIDETYTEQGIAVKFPQLTKANNPSKSDTINKAIQENIRGILDNLRSEGADLGALTLDLKCETAGYGNKVLSIIYQGYAHYEQAASPINVYYTQNIDLGDDVNTIALKDIFTINDTFVEGFKTGIYSPYRTDLDLGKSGVNLKEAIEQQYSNQDLINLFQKAEARYKMTQYGVIVSVEVPHVLGDHLEMAINYENIEKNIIKSSPVWKDYLFKIN